MSLDLAEEIDRTKLRYVLYARKSTSGEDSQTRSIPDQIKHCEDMARRNSLNIVKTIKEQKSAKIAGERPLFKQLLDDIGANKYDAIIAWAPDRLARNMLEGGQIINLIDEKSIKDLQFPAHHFTNDPSGKLTLGIMFSISKHFSDDLSRKVKRGIDGNLEEGKSSGTPRWGYDRDTNGIYRPNEYFDVVQKAWTLRSEGMPYQGIVDFLKENNVHRETKPKKGKVKTIWPSVNGVAKMFKQPFYYGILLQTKQEVDLREMFSDFKCMIEEDLFNKVQAVGYTRTRDTSNKKQLEFKPLSRFVYCAVCFGTNSDKNGNPAWMLVGKNKPGHSKEYVLSYRCDNKQCTRRVKSVRAHFIFDAIYRQLDALHLTDEAYERYSARVEAYTDEKLIEIRQNIHSKSGYLAHVKNELNTLSLSLGKIPADSPAFAINNAKINELAAERDKLGGEIATLETKIANPSRIKLTKDQFLNLLKTAPNKMRAGSAVEKDRLARIFFLNLRVDNENSLTFIWREPFASLVRAISISSGTDERT